MHIKSKEPNHSLTAVDIFDINDVDWLDTWDKNRSPKYELRNLLHKITDQLTLSLPNPCTAGG